MSITIISGNIQAYGGAGQFEGDRSTWGFANGSVWNAIRDSAYKHAGVFAAKISYTGAKSSEWTDLIPGKVNSIQNGKYYQAQAWVYIPTGSMPTEGTDVLAFHGGANVSEEYAITKTFSTLEGNWQQILFRFKWTGPTNDGGPHFHISIQDASVTSGSAGFIYVDEFEIYEYENDAPPPCTLVLDVSGTVVTDESAPSAGDGSIEVAHTGGTGTIEYSKDNGSTWQSSNQFTGLASGVYVVQVRDANGCVDTASFSINPGAASFSFTAAVVDESVTGATDGSITITTSGTGSPFTFSKDGGSTFQSSNVFSGLSAGNYTIVVKATDDSTASQTVTVEAGIVVFDHVYLSKNPIPYSLPQTSNSSEENYKLFIDVRVEDVPGSGIFTSKMKSSKPPDSAGIAKFNLRQAFRGMFDPAPPTLNQAGLVKLADRAKLYKIYFGDIFDDLDEPSSLTGSNPFMVALGGLSKEKYPDVDLFYTLLPTTKQFMTWAPNGKTVDYNQEDYLDFWLYDASIVQAKLNVKAYFDDDTNEASQIGTLSGIQYGDILQVPSGPLNSGAVGINPAKNPVKYDIWLTDQADLIISETRTYIISDFKHPATRYYMFLNSLGAYEVLAFTGSSEENAAYSRTVSQAYLQDVYNATDGEFKSGNVFKRNHTDNSSGFFRGQSSQQWLEYMQDFLLSTRIYDITDGTRRPVLIDGDNEALVRKDKDNRRFIRFRTIGGYMDQNYTPATL